MDQPNKKLEQEPLMKERIQSERLLLVPISMQYREEIFSEFTHEITTYMYPAPATEISQTEEFIATAIKDLREGSHFQLVILAKDSQEFFGCAGLHHLDCNTPEMGIWVKKSAHGKGYGKEAMIAIKNWADDLQSC